MESTKNKFGEMAAHNPTGAKFSGTNQYRCSLTTEGFKGGRLVTKILRQSVSRLSVKSFCGLVIISLLFSIRGNVCFAEVWKGTITKIDGLTYDTVGGQIAYDEKNHPRKIGVHISVDTRKDKNPRAEDFRISGSTNLVQLYRHKCSVSKKYNKTECTGYRTLNSGGELCKATSFFSVPKSRPTGFGTVIQIYTCPDSDVRAVITWGGTVRRVKR